MRVLHSIGSLDLRMGGSVQAVVDTVRLQARAGIEVSLTGTVHEGDDLGYLVDLGAEGVRVHDFPRDAPKGRLGSRALNQWIRQSCTSFDLIEVHGVFTRTSFAVGRAARLADVPYVVRPHGQLEPYDLSKHASAKTLIAPVLTRPLLAGATALVMTSSMERDRANLYGAGTPCSVVGLPVHVDDGPATPAEKQMARRRLGIDQDERIVLFIGRIDPKKGLQFLVPAAKRVAAGGASLTLVIAGSGDADSESALDRELDSGDNPLKVARLGRVSGQLKRDVFAAADVFALPSLTENFGITVVEAMAFGLPMLISDNVSMHQSVSSCGAGVVCQATIESTQVGLAKLLTKDLNRMGSASRRMFEDEFDPARVMQATRALYARLLGQAPDV